MGACSPLSSSRTAKATERWRIQTPLTPGSPRRRVQMSVSAAFLITVLVVCVSPGIGVVYTLSTALVNIAGIQSASSELVELSGD